ncbi:MAG: hypothetical protein OXH11_21075 [Candidatus Aminicenantes bacterium]|nr:hypothetical protein [Candidatus Aminicenantes bacterium]
MPRTSLAASGLACLVLTLTAGAQEARPAQETETWERQAQAYLKSILYPPEQVEDWILGRASLGEAYDGELGWLFHDRRVKHGVDGSISTYRYAGARRTIMYGDNPCRINTYGNSFTHCDQVSDGETWQEVLAAHLCEPLRNYGVGGYSVYQAYLRMMREETITPARYIIFNIYDDDHYRNLHGWRNVRLGYTTGMWPAVLGSTMPYVAANPATGQFTEYKNPCPTPESVRNLSDFDWVFERFKDDFVLKIVLAQRDPGAGSLQPRYDVIEELAREHGLQVSIGTPEELKRTATELYTRAALFATMRIIEKIEHYASAQGKQVLFVLSYGQRNAAKVLKTGERFDQSLLDFLDEKRLPYVDLLEAHGTDFAQFKVTVDEYIRRYWIGHYNPLGNFFQAFAIKDRLVELLDPKPISYSTDPSKYIEMKPNRR